MSEKGKTLVERHALKRLAKVEKNKQKAYEKKPKEIPWKTIIMGVCFTFILVMILLQTFVR